MAKTAVVRARTEPALKEYAGKILNDLGIKPSEAIQNQVRLFNHLKAINPAAAQRAAMLICQEAGKLKEWPNRCRPMNDGSDRRDLIIQFGSGAYVLRYVLDAELIIMLRVWYSKELRT